MKCNVKSSLRRRDSSSLGFRGLVWFLLLLSLCVACSKSSDGSGAGPAPPGRDRKTVSVSPGIGVLDPHYRPKNLDSKTFTLGSVTYSPLDFDAYDLSLVFDVPSKTIRGTARIQFHQNQTSRPFFLLDGIIADITIDGIPTPFEIIKDPANLNNLVTIEQALYANHAHEAVINYIIAADRVNFSGGGVGFVTDYADLLGRFFEKYGPSGYEDDSFTMSMHLKLIGALNPHHVFSNGEITEVSKSEWLITFPPYFSMSSLFVHLTDRPLVINKFVYSGIARDIPVTVYSENASNVDLASAKIPSLFAELEADYGPYSHPSFVVYINDGAGGMEYVGATITSIHSLGHELFHSWFARGAMPAEGRAGWIDEALASWRDIGYLRATSLLSRPQTNLAGASVFNRATPFNCYVDGRALMGEFDSLFSAAGGLKPLLRDFIEKYRFSIYTTDEFRAFLEERTGADLSAFFARYVFGKQGQSIQADGFGESLHPQALTEEELKRLR